MENNETQEHIDNVPITPETVLEQLRALRQQIPEYAQRTTAGARPLRTAASADPQFVGACVNAVGASSAVSAALGTTPEELRQTMEETARWTAVEDELRATLEGVRNANLTRRYRIGLTALQTYHISRQLVRRPEHANLLPHVQEMRRLNQFGRRVKKPVPPDVITTTTTPTP